MMDPPFPLGVPTVCFVHLDDGLNPSSAAATDPGGGKVGIDGRPYEVDKVFDTRLDADAEVFQQMLQVTPDDSHQPVPLTTFVEDAVSLCVLVNGTSQSVKRLLYQGGDDGDDSFGLIGWVFDPIFHLLRDKGFGMHGFYEFEVAVAFYEIYDETITDLLRPDNHDMRIRLDPFRGFEVDGVSKVVISSPSDGRRAVQTGKRNRKTQVLPSGPAQEAASAVLHISLTQREGESVEQYTNLHSDFLLVEGPSTHKLINSADDLRLTEGPTLNRSLLALKEVCKALSTEKQVRFAPFGEGKLTEVLQGFLGGNAIVLCMTCLSRSDSVKVNTATMTMIQHLRSAMHYPVANTELIQGLAMKYRFMLANSIEGKGVARGFGGVAGGDGAVNSQRMRALEGQVLQAKMESNESKEDAAKVYKMLELFKAKYVKLVETKAAQSRELITAEEGKLDVARSLLDLKLEHSNVLEKFESDRYALTTDLLAAKNEVVDLEMRLQEAEAGLTAKEREAATAIDDRDAIQEKLVQAEKNAKEMQERFGVEEAKTIEMGAELLTLVNQKTHLDEVRQDFERQVEQLSGKCRMLEQDLKASEDKDRTRSIDLDEAHQKVNLLQVAKAKAELDLQQAQVEWDKQLLEKNRVIQEGAHERDADSLRHQMGDLEQLSRLKAENEILMKTQEDLRSEVKQIESKHKESQEKLLKLANNAEAAQEGPVMAREERSPSATKDDQRRRRRRRKDDMGGSVVDSNEVDALKARTRDAIMKNQALFDRYTQLRGVVETSMGAEKLPPDLPDDEGLIAEGAAVIGALQADAQELSRLKKENETLKLKVEGNNQAPGVEKQLQEMREKMEKMASSATSIGQHPSSERITAATEPLLQRISEAEAERDRALDELAKRRNRRGWADDGGGSIEVLRKELERTERRNAELVSKNSFLSAELENFKTYMRATVARYQATINRQQGELRRVK